MMSLGRSLLPCVNLAILTHSLIFVLLNPLNTASNIVVAKYDFLSIKDLHSERNNTILFLEYKLSTYNISG
jgi:hypothetical protein